MRPPGSGGACHVAPAGARRQSFAGGGRALNAPAPPPAGKVDTPAMAYLLLTMASLFWSGVFVIGRGTTEHVPPVALSFFRFFVSIAILLPLAWRPLMRQWRLVLGAWPWYLVLGVFSIAFFPIILMLGLGRTTAINASLINSTQPIWTVLLSFIVFRERINARQGLGIAVSLLGVLTILPQGAPHLILDISLNLGDLYVVYTLFLWAIYSIFLRYLPPQVDPLVTALALIVAGVPFIIPFYALEVAGGRTMTLDWETAAVLLYFGTLPSFVALVFWNRGVVAIGPSRAAMFAHLIPVFGTILAVIVLGEMLYGFHAVGIGLVLVGIYLATARSVLPWRLRRSPPRAP